MEKLLVWIGLAVGGWLGWAVGAAFSMTAAVMLGFVGTGLGLYGARRLARTFF
jgi:hypothetical protein